MSLASIFAYFALIEVDRTINVGAARVVKLYIISRATSFESVKSVSSFLSQYFYYMWQIFSPEFARHTLALNVLN